MLHLYNTTQHTNQWITNPPNSHRRYCIAFVVLRQFSADTSRLVYKWRGLQWPERGSSVQWKKFQKYELFRKIWFFVQFLQQNHIKIVVFVTKKRCYIEILIRIALTSMITYECDWKKHFNRIEMTWKCKMPAVTALYINFVWIWVFMLQIAA